MSLPWNRSVQLHLGARTIRGSLRTGWLRRTVLARASHEIEMSAQSFDEHPPHAVDADPRSRAIDAVLAELADSNPVRGSRLSVEVAEELVLLDVVLGDFGGSSERQLQAIATACANELLGDAAAEQSVRWQLQPDLRHLLIGTIALQDIELLEQAASRHGLGMESLQPGFCTHWNRHADALADGSGVFSVMSKEYAVVACATRGSIIAVGSGHCPNDFDAPGSDTSPASSLDARADRLLASVGLDPDSVPAFVLVAPDPQAATLSTRWTVVTGETEAP